MRIAKAVSVILAALFCVSMIAGVTAAEEKISVKGKIKDYDIDNKSVVVTCDDGKEMTFIIENDGALKKLDDRLFKGDEVKIKYVVEDGKNKVKLNSDFKGTKPGC